MKRARKSSRKVPNSDGNVDRLSDLPDGVICHILSFLETRESVQTSILAKRWRFLWAHVPVLAFDNWHFDSELATSFPSIICTVMLQHKVQSLNTFRLTYMEEDADYDGPCYELERCIATVVKRNVQNLHLERLRVKVPRCLLTCKTLVDLTMRDGVTIPPTAHISLPILKKLHLYYLNCEIDFTRLLSGCPVLEELYIEGTTCRDPRGCYISSPTLKRLTIIFLLDESMFNNPDYMVTINTPALAYLKVYEESFKHISISLCSSLVKADVSFDSFCELDDFNNQYLLKFLNSIRYVKCLKLKDSCDKIWEGRMPGSIAKFANLTKLHMYGNLCTLTKFFESADHLRVLLLTIFKDSVDSEHWLDPVEEHCACLLHSLKTVRICNFSCFEQGFNMVRYILRNAQVLERLEINCLCVDWKEKFEAIQRISIFPRESKKCEIHFS